MALANVGVPRNHIEIARDHAAVETIRPAESAEICRDELPLVDLVLLKPAPLVGDEALVIEHQPGIAAASGHRDLVPTRIRLAPVSGDPVGVELVKGAVARLQPVVEEPLRFVVERVLGVFVVDLPADDVRVVAETRRHLLDDLATQLAILRARIGKLPPRPVFHTLAAFGHAQRLGIFRREPCRRRIRWRAEHHDQVMRAGGVDRALEPVKRVAALARLHAAPRKLTDAHHPEACFLHQCEIGIPARLRPLLGIPRGAEHERRDRDDIRAAHRRDRSREHRGHHQPRLRSHKFIFPPRAWRSQP